MEYLQDRTKPRFGISGLDDLFYNQGLKHTYQMPKWLSQMGLDAFEYSFGRGVNIGMESCHKIGVECKAMDIAISGHAPYYVNYTNPDNEKIQAAHKYIIDSCIATKAMNGHRVVVHVGVQSKTLTRQQSVELIAQHIQELAKKMDENGLQDFILCLETMGKYSQIGDYMEIASLCSVDDRFMPCFDFGHINCTMQGALKQTQDFEKILNYCIDKLGSAKIKNTHVHFSKIQYGKAGELRHINFDDTVFGPEFEPFAQALVNLNLTPTIICESMSTRCADALYMQNAYNNLLQ